MSKRNRSQGEENQSKKQKTSFGSDEDLNNITQPKQEKQTKISDYHSELSRTGSKKCISQTELTLETPGITKQQRSQLLRQKRREAGRKKKAEKREARKIKQERARLLKKLNKNTDKYDKEKRKQNKERKQLLKAQRKEHTTFPHPNSLSSSTHVEDNSNAPASRHLNDDARQSRHSAVQQQKASNYTRASHLLKKALEVSDQVTQIDSQQTGISPHDAMLIDKLAFAVAKIPHHERANHTFPILPSLTKPGPASRFYAQQILYHSDESLNPPLLFDGFFFGRIPQVISQCYASAGIIPYCVKKGKCYILLGLEDRSLKNDKSIVWSYFGGKKKRRENPVDTAVREFTEETLCCLENSEQLSQSSLRAKLTNYDERFPFWCLEGLALLFFVRVDYDSSIPETFQQARQTYVEEHSESEVNCDQLNIAWICTSKVMKAVREDQPLYPQQHIMKYFAMNILANESLQHVFDSQFEVLVQF